MLVICDLFQTFDNAVSELDSLCEDSYEDSTQKLQLLRDMITISVSLLSQTWVSYGLASADEISAESAAKYQFLRCIEITIFVFA